MAQAPRPGAASPAARLAGATGVQRVPARELELFVVRGFLDPLVGTVDARIAALLGLPLEASEPLQGQRYAPGQEFRPHTDTFEPGGFDYYVHTADRGQRTWTAMVYLNEPEDGGATRFKTIGKTVQPKTGKLLAWNNLLPDGRANPATLHQGMKVRRGTKYVLTKWFREHAS